MVRRPRVIGAATMVLLTASAFAFGYAISLVASRFGSLMPLAVIAIPLLPAWAVAVFLDPRIGVGTVIILAPVGTRQVPGLPVDLIQLAIVGVGAIVVLRRTAEGRTPLPLPTPLWWVVALLGWSLVALPSALDGRVGMRAVSALAGELLFATIVVAACRNRHDVRVVLAVFVGIAFVGALQAPADARNLHSAFGASVVEGRASSFFTEPNQLGTFCMLSALVALGIALSARTRRGRLVGLGLSGMIGVGLLLSFSRGSWIGFTAGMVVLVVALSEARRLLIAVGIPFILVAFLIGSFAPTNPQVVVVGQRLKSITGERNPYDDRPSIWAEARREIEADPLTGEGPGNFPVASERATSESRSTYAFHAHNLLLTWGAEDGLPAVACILGFAVHLVTRVRRAARVAPRRDLPLLFGLAAAGVAVLGQGVVDYTLRNSVVYTAVFTVLACLVVAAGDEDSA
jgi:O-antigen ligase